jgi:HD-like signal output (HDOD) protein
MLTASLDLREKDLREKDVRDRILRSLGQLPPFSPVLNKLLASLAREDVSFAELSQLIEKDTVLSGNVLRLVNSAAYARRGEVNSITHAITVLGLSKLRNLVLGLSIARMWVGVKTPPAWSHARFNLHSIATAILTDQLSQHLTVSYPEGAFVAGLFHDFGKMLIAISMPAEFQEIAEMHQLGARPWWECEREVLGLDHARVSVMALAEWNLPTPIQRAVAFHHHSLDNPHYQTEKGDAQFHLSELLEKADRIVNGMGHVVMPVAESHPAETTALIREMLPTAEQVESSFRTEFETIRSFF